MVEPAGEITMSWKNILKIMAVPVESEHVEERMSVKEKQETCDYCDRKPVLKCNRCKQKLCKTHLSVPCK